MLCTILVCKKANNLDEISLNHESSDLEEEDAIDDEFEKMNHPLRYHLKQHFRMRRQQRKNERRLSINEMSSAGGNNKVHSRCHELEFFNICCKNAQDKIGLIDVQIIFPINVLSLGSAYLQD